MVTETTFVDPVNHYVIDLLKREVDPEIMIGATQVYQKMIQNNTKPVLIYSWVINGIEENYMVRDDMIVYTFFSQDDTQMRKFQNAIIRNLGGDYEASARRVNDFVAVSGINELKAFDYNFITVQTSSGIEGAQEQNGRFSMTMTLRVGWQRA